MRRLVLSLGCARGAPPLACLLPSRACLVPSPACSLAPQPRAHTGQRKRRPVSLRGIGQRRNGNNLSTIKPHERGVDPLTDVHDSRGRGHRYAGALPVLGARGGRQHSLDVTPARPELGLQRLREGLQNRLGILFSLIGRRSQCAAEGGAFDAATLLISGTRRVATMKANMMKRKASA